MKLCWDGEGRKVYRITTPEVWSYKYLVLEWCKRDDGAMRYTVKSVGGLDRNGSGFRDTTILLNLLVRT